MNNIKKTKTNKVVNGTSSRHLALVIGWTSPEARCGSEWGCRIRRRWGFLHRCSHSPVAASPSPWQRRWSDRWSPHLGPPPWETDREEAVTDSGYGSEGSSGGHHITETTFWLIQVTVNHLWVHYSVTPIHPYKSNTKLTKSAVDS